MLNSQKYADLVFQRVNALDPESDEAGHYRSLCRRAGGIFRTVGLVQFSAFIAAKGHKYRYYKWLSDHLCQELAATGAVQAGDEASFLAEIRGMDLPRYMQTSRVALKLLLWHKRLAEIMIARETEEPSHED